MKVLCDTLGLEGPIRPQAHHSGALSPRPMRRPCPGMTAKLVHNFRGRRVRFPTVYAAFERVGGLQHGQAARNYWSAPARSTRHG